MVAKPIEKRGVKGKVLLWMEIPRRITKATTMIKIGGEYTYLEEGPVGVAGSCDSYGWFLSVFL